MNQSKDDSTGIVGFIVVLVIVGGIIFAINKNWDSIVHIIGGLAVGGVAVFILGASTDRNPKAQGIAFGIYFLGAFFSGVISYLKFSLTSWTVLHATLSWVGVALLLR